MEISGRITQILPLQSGEGRNGPWRKQEFIIETDGQYPRKVCIAVWGDKIDQFTLKEGERVRASVNIESREFNGRWYTDVKAWRLEQDEAQGGGLASPGAIAEPPPLDIPLPDQEPPDTMAQEDDLPF